MINVKKPIAYLMFAGLSWLSFSVFAATDSEINSAVESKISNNATTAQSKVTVTTNKGVVSLSGNLQTEGEASTAIEDASSVNGVKDVNTDKLMVKDGSQPYKDTYITAKIKGAYMKEKVFGDKAMDVIGVSVETKDGIVYLTGTADNQAQINSAVSVAKGIKGVDSVKSTVVIK